MDAMELLYIYSNEKIKVSGWKGIILTATGEQIESKKYFAKDSYQLLPFDSVIAMTKLAIMQTNAEWLEKKEIENTELFYAISKET